MKLSTDDLITMQCALASAIDTIKEKLSQSISAPLL